MRSPHCLKFALPYVRIALKCGTLAQTIRRSVSPVGDSSAFLIASSLSIVEPAVAHPFPVHPIAGSGNIGKLLEHFDRPYSHIVNEKF